jgi:hypothetical protein
VTPARSLTVALLALGVLIATRPGAEAQFPHGLLAAPPKGKPDNGLCTIETRPLSFGNYDPEANADLDALAQVIYTCNNHASKIRIENDDRRLEPVRPLHVCQEPRIALSTTSTSTRLARRYGPGLYGTDVYFESNPPNGTPVVVPAFGRIRRGQNVEPGEYLDALTVRILF